MKKVLKNKKIWIIAIVILTIGLFVGEYYSYHYFNKPNQKVEEKQNKKNSKKKKQTTNKETENAKVLESKSNNDNEPPTETNNVNTSYNNTTKNSTSNTQYKNNTNVNNSPQANESNHYQNNNNNNNNTNSSNTPTPWGALGISEYDYYHKPSNPNITTYYKTTAECEEAGSKMGNHYMCMQVNSYSGDIIGYMVVQ